MATYKKIIDYLNLSKIKYELIHHEKAHTCELSAQARGMELKYGGKTLLFKAKDGFKLFSLSAALEVDSSKVRKILNSQKLRFASNEELQNLCSVKKGALPPFGTPVFEVPLFLDVSIYQNDFIAFNAGVLDHSVILKTQDYLTLVDPQKCSFAKN